MNFMCKKSELSKAIGNVSKAIPSKTNIQTLEGIKVKIIPGTVELTGYNLEMGIRTSIDAITSDNCEFVVDARLFNEFTKKMNGDDIKVDIDENNVIRISSLNTECSFSAMSAENYPEMPIIDSEMGLIIKQSVLASMINQTTYATSTNESKPVLTGELFDIEDGNFNMVAIDGFRLAIRTENIDNKEKYHFVVPQKTLTEVSSLIKKDSEKDCVIYTNDRHIVFEINGFFVISRLLDGVFHNYKMSIPNSHKTEVIVDKKDLSTCLERCSLIINEKNKAPVRCEIGGGVMKISCKTGIGKVNDAISADITGETVTIGFNNRFVLEALKAADGDKVRIRLNDVNSAIEIIPQNGDNHISLVMPIQLKK